ncbi:MAG: molybdopterin-guanine dinucleotide biosynthesis protein A [Alphaproteobacteria bacterium]
MSRAAGLIVAVVLSLAFWPAAEAKEHHAGYYFPTPRSEEVYTARAQVLPDSDRARRLAFVTAFTVQMLSQPYPPQFVVFAKGDSAEKLIIVATQDHAYNTLYRARALFAMMTAVARQTPFFQDYGVEDFFTFFDLAKLLGFKNITFSDGNKFAHRIVLK